MSSYYPSIEDLRKSQDYSFEFDKKLQSIMVPNHGVRKHFKGLQFGVGKLFRTDGFKVDKTISDLENNIKKTDDPDQKQNLKNLLSRLTSVFDLTENLYERFNSNKNSLMYWYPSLKEATKKQTFFKLPKTQAIRLPIELSQFIRIEYQDTNDESRKWFNDWLVDELKLDKDKEYFIKTGTFSSKFEFRNAHLTEPLEIGEYYQVINNFAMEVGDGHTNDLVVREWIPDPDNHLTIYDGMPLRTEFRSFIDLDTKTLIDTVPYWNPLVMKRVLSAQGLHIPDIQADYQTYLKAEPRLNREFNDSVTVVNKEIKELLKSFDGLSSRWSLDTMKSGDDYYLIDMAEMDSSALTELINPSKLDEANRIKLSSKDH